MSINLDSSIIVAFVALAGTVINSIVMGDKQSKKDAVAMEHRLTDMESAIKYKVDPLWNMIEKSFPKLAERADTPDLDVLLRKYRIDPAAMVEDELVTLLDGIENEFLKIQVDENQARGRGVVLAFLSVPVRSRLEALQRKRICD